MMLRRKAFHKGHVVSNELINAKDDSYIANMFRIQDDLLIIRFVRDYDEEVEWTRISENVMSWKHDEQRDGAGCTWCGAFAQVNSDNLCRECYGRMSNE